MQALKNKKIGYALGGGGARGYFHIGVLKVLEEYNVFPDVIAGTSMGSIIGALYASGLNAKEIEQMAVGMDWKRLIVLADIIVPLNGLIQGRRVTSLLKSILKARTFAHLKKDFACVATDLNTGEQVVLNEGSLIEAVRASSSIPAIFTPVKLKGRYLIDGGLVNVVPVSVCRDMGADFVIGVNVIPGPREKVSIQEAFEKYHTYQLHSLPERGFT
jgi:NTE family protein